MANTQARHRKATRPITPIDDAWKALKELDKTKQLSAVAGSGLALSVIAAGAVVPDQNPSAPAAPAVVDASEVVKEASESFSQNEAVSSVANLETEEVTVKKVAVARPSLTGGAIENPGGAGARISVRPWESITPQGDTSNPAVAVAVRYLGRPYVWAASGPDAFDCSGYISFIYRQLGYNLPHSSAAYPGMAHQVPLSQLKPGDILYRPGHVGMYIGDGKFVHSNHPGGGTVVASMGAFGSGWSGAVRIL